MSKMQIKKQRAEKKGFHPVKHQGQWWIVRSVGGGDIVGPFSKREAYNGAYHASLQPTPIIEIVVHDSEGNVVQHDKYKAW